MSRIRLIRKDGTPSAYFWSDKDGSAMSAKTLYKRTVEGIKRIRGAHYDAKRKRIVKT